MAELIRGKTGRVYGALISMLTTMKALPLAYDKDMQEDKEPVFDAIDTVLGCIHIFRGMLATMKFNRTKMKESARKGFTNATDAADYLVNRGLPFRDAHAVVGKLVLKGIQENKPLEDFTLDELKSFCPLFEKDVYSAISLEACVERRNGIGAPGRAAMEQEITEAEEYLGKM